MGKMLSGIVSAIGAVVWLLYGLGCEFNAPGPWGLDKIPAAWFFDVQIPRMFVLGLAVIWFGGGIKLVVEGLGNVASVNAFAAELRAGNDVAQLLETDVRKTSWSNPICELAALSIIRRQPYPAAIESIVKETGNTLDDAVLAYRLAVDFLQDRCALIRQAARKAGVNCSLPEFSFCAVRIKQSQKRTLADRLTKVDLSSTGNLTPLLTQDDLVYSYDGKLIWTAEQLAQQAAGSAAREEVPLAVLRHVKTTNTHPIMEVADEYAWQALSFTIAGGPIPVAFETHGLQRQNQLSLPPPLPPQPLPDAASGAEPRFIRFKCSQCGKRLKSLAAIGGRKAKCPKCKWPLTMPMGNE